MSDRRETVSLEEKRKRGAQRRKARPAVAVARGPATAPRRTSRCGSTTSVLARRLLAGMAIAAAVLVMAQPVARWLMGPYLFVRMRTVPARAGVLETGVSAKGVLVREESVVFSPIAGRLSLLAKEGERVGRGTQVLRVENSGMPDTAIPRAAEVEDDLMRLELRQVRRRDELAKEIIEAQASIDEARLGLSSPRGAIVSRSRRKLRECIDRLLVLTRAKAGLDRSAEPQRAALAAKRKSVWSAMGQSEYLYRASMSGLVSYATDGLEGALSLHGRREDLGRALESVFVQDPEGKAELTRARDAAIVPAGAPVARVIDNFSLCIATLLSARVAEGLRGCRVTVRFDSLPTQSFVGTYYQALPAASEEEAIVLFSLDDYAPEFTNLRTDGVEVINDQCEGVIIPRSAVVAMGEGVKGVFMARASYPVFQRVEVRGESGKQCVISGVPEGTSVVKNPWVVPRRFYGR